jgi:hypothetical protein
MPRFRAYYITPPFRMPDGAEQVRLAIMPHSKEVGLCGLSGLIQGAMLRDSGTIPTRKEAARFIRSARRLRWAIARKDK